MTCVYFDCFAGAAGDMIVGALLDAGCDFQELEKQLSKLGLHEYSLGKRPVHRAGIGGIKFDVNLGEAEHHGHGHDHDHHEHEHEHEHGHEHHHHPHHRSLSDILTMIDQADLPARAAERARKVFTRLGHAEAAAHRCHIDEVHFHEVGAVDSIVDIVGTCLALELMGIDTIYSSPIPLGSGTVKCAHGTIPVPAPATAELLRGFQTTPGLLAHEMTTPTGAAILTALAENIGPMPEMDIQRIGYGAGSRDFEQLPNLLRIFVGAPSQQSTSDTVVEIAANIDDCSSEILAATMESLLAAGCLDAWTVPVTMKKSRPAWQLSVLCHPADVEAAEQILFSETTTFGIRRHLCQRTKLQREFKTVETAYGAIRVKLGRKGNEVYTISPEFADCQSAAQTHHVPVRQVLDEARAAYQQETDNA